VHRRRIAIARLRDLALIPAIIAIAIVGQVVNPVFLRSDNLINVLQTMSEIAVLVLAGFVGYTVISKVPNTLHTPLMSGTNAIHGIVVLGGLLLMAESSGVLEKILLVIAVAFGTINVIGGFLVTDRMLGMFKQKEPPKADEEAPE
jgi:NAD(P) transhydrogenase subunit alpha